MRRLWFAAVLLVAVQVIADPAAAHGYAKNGLQVRHPWIPASTAGTVNGRAYLEIRNSAKDADWLIGATSPVAEQIELIDQEGKTARIEIAPRQRVLLEPRGGHLMIRGLRQSLRAGERIPLDLRFERAGVLRVELEIQAADSKRPRH